MRKIQEWRFTGMICHLVFYRMKIGRSTIEETKLMEEARRGLPRVPGVRNLRVGKSITGLEKGYSVALVMDFEDAAALEAYRVDRGHQSFVKGIAEPLVEEIRRFDFEW
jgi:Stress responsive A/B Barrel Domain